MQQSLLNQILMGVILKSCKRNEPVAIRLLEYPRTRCRALPWQLFCAIAVRR
jgi:hypothetical protein